MFLIDTDHFTILQRQTQPEFARLWPRMTAHPARAFFVAVVSFQEQALGWNAYISQARDRSGLVRGYAMFQQVLADFAAAQVLPLDDRAAALCESLRARRVRIATMDLRIAAIALDRDLTVLTRNLNDFGKVPGLRVEDWTA